MITSNNTITSTHLDPYIQSIGGVPISHGGITIGHSFISDTLDEVSGQMVLIEKVIDPSSEKIPDKETMKQMLVEGLVQKILQHKFVEYTMQEDFKTGLITYRARAFLTVDDKVRQLRKEGY